MVFKMTEVSQFMGSSSPSVLDACSAGVCHDLPCCCTCLKRHKTPLSSDVCMNRV